MNTKHVTDRKERRELKRKARKARPALAARPSGVARGSLKRKVKVMIRGQRKR
ncbi:MAG: hypothetical protein SGI92_08815 [Bryobacteraceae bacterium]|jgi:hypothetical protein|nr:hypothetical protein [Bryobacteraceae bacterium]